MSSKPIVLVVVAHPDDETFGCGSLLMHCTRRGADTVVMCATRGDAGLIDPRVTDPVHDLGALRETELRAAAELLGVSRVEVLDWQDSGMEGAAGPETLVGAPIEEVTAAVAALIDELSPEVVVTLDASDGHRDHARIRDATLAAVDQATWSTPSVYLHCLPRELMARWAAELAARQPGSDYLAVAELGTPEELITTVIDTHDTYEQREAAIALHASQTSPFEVMPDDLRRTFLSAERLRRIRPPWPGGPPESDLLADA
jgi:LmbE family N-acetylglucosaminyl deacetylase